MGYKNHLLLHDDKGKRYRACRYNDRTDDCLPVSEFLARPEDLRCKHCERVLRTQEDQSAYTLAEAKERAQRLAMERNMSVYVYRYQYQRLSKKFDGYLTSTNPYRARGWEDGLHECCIELVEVVAPTPLPATQVNRVPLPNSGISLPTIRVELRANEGVSHHEDRDHTRIAAQVLTRRGAPTVHIYRPDNGAFFTSMTRRSPSQNIMHIETVHAATPLVTPASQSTTKARAQCKPPPQKSILYDEVLGFVGYVCAVVASPILATLWFYIGFPFSVIYHLHHEFKIRPRSWVVAAIAAAGLFGVVSDARGLDSSLRLVKILGCLVVIVFCITMLGAAFTNAFRRAVRQR